MASENPNVVVVDPVVENEEQFESEISNKLVIGEGSKGKISMSKKMIVLRTSDGESFEIDESIAVQSQTIAHLVEDDCADTEIPLPNVTGEILSKVIEYCRKHVGDSEFASDEVKEDLKKWDAEFMQMMFDQSMMFDMILAANYLNVKNLLDQACQTVADMISACKTSDEIREKFEIEKDFTPEEEEELRKETQWAFE